ncbi:Fe2+-enterobactin ABC transporter substrate-binding protein [Marinomonas rhizomae]|uniref:Iron complex transport system substrate-binding protein n=1 Tax=Marinomonas rhizomae TaxID=491948 RepID=A0A366JIX9_9GAMM|nr:Fe2+-enterobactin ABC transporter substrate-binding protein [Marinomonas rhizomae]RBP85778.1 iron complex transport system substrate-binding protein [Marinomonas rhizomae]RNF75603.1 Fe2+-enterobactin ABC transporter substrate-binding protein [Marinomonas rhizomae]
MVGITGLVRCMLLSAVFLTIVTGCEQNRDAEPHLALWQVSQAKSGWPRSIQTEQGLLTLTHPPKRIVSTSVTLTGTLLAINAPIVASGGTMANTGVAGEDGFMRQWETVAKQRNLVSLYQTEANAEAIVAARPDLIIISATGGDSARKLYAQLKDIAPTLIIGYDDKSWMQLANIFGQFLGLEERAQAVISQFEQEVQNTKQMIQLPPQPTTAMVYYQDNTGGNIWTHESAQGRLLSELGFQLAKVPDSVKGDNSMGQRNDIIIATGERFPDAITGQSVLLFAAASERENDFIHTPYLQTTQAVKNRQVYAVGNDTFRLDYYSATNLLHRLQTLFGHPNHAN